MKDTVALKSCCPYNIVRAATSRTFNKWSQIYIIKKLSCYFIKVTIKQFFLHKFTFFVI
jgi:hypothetical protein